MPTTRGTEEARGVAPEFPGHTQDGRRAIGGRIGLKAGLIVRWMSAMWPIGLESIMGFQHIPVLLMVFIASGALSAAAIGGNSAWNRRVGD